MTKNGCDSHPSNEYLPPTMRPVKDPSSVMLDNIVHPSYLDFHMVVNGKPFSMSNSAACPYVATGKQIGEDYNEDDPVEQGKAMQRTPAYSEDFQTIDPRLGSDTVIIRDYTAIDATTRAKIAKAVVGSTEMYHSFLGKFVDLLFGASMKTFFEGMIGKYQKLQQKLLVKDDPLVRKLIEVYQNVSKKDESLGKYNPVTGPGEIPAENQNLFIAQLANHINKVSAVGVESVLDLSECLENHIAALRMLANACNSWATKEDDMLLLLVRASDYGRQWCDDRLILETEQHCAKVWVNYDKIQLALPAGDLQMKTPSRFTFGTFREEQDPVVRSNNKTAEVVEAVEVDTMLVPIGCWAGAVTGHASSHAATYGWGFGHAETLLGANGEWAYLPTHAVDGTYQTSKVHIRRPETSFVNTTVASVPTQTLRDTLRGSRDVTRGDHRYRSSTQTMPTFSVLHSDLQGARVQSKTPLPRSHREACPSLNTIAIVNKDVIVGANTTGGCYPGPIQDPFVRHMPECIKQDGNGEFRFPQKVLARLKWADLPDSVLKEWTRDAYYQTETPPTTRTDAIRMLAVTNKQHFPFLEDETVAEQYVFEGYTFDLSYVKFNLDADTTVRLDGVECTPQERVRLQIILVYKTLIYSLGPVLAGKFISVSEHVLNVGDVGGASNDNCKQIATYLKIATRTTYSPDDRCHLALHYMLEWLKTYRDNRGYSPLDSRQRAKFLNRSVEGQWSMRLGTESNPIEIPLAALSETDNAKTFTTAYKRMGPFLDALIALRGEDALPASKSKMNHKYGAAQQLVSDEEDRQRDEEDRRRRQPAEYVNVDNTGAARPINTDGYNQVGKPQVYAMIGAAALLYANRTYLYPSAECGTNTTPAPPLHYVAELLLNQHIKAREVYASAAKLSGITPGTPFEEAVRASPTKAHPTCFMGSKPEHEFKKLFPLLLRSPLREKMRRASSIDLMYAMLPAYKSGVTSSSCGVPGAFMIFPENVRRELMEKVGLIDEAHKMPVNPWCGHRDGPCLRTVYDISSNSPYRGYNEECVNPRNAQLYEQWKQWGCSYQQPSVANADGTSECHYPFSKRNGVPVCADFMPHCVKRCNDPKYAARHQELVVSRFGNIGRMRLRSPHGYNDGPLADYLQFDWKPSKKAHLSQEERELQTPVDEVWVSNFMAYARRHASIALASFRNDASEQKARVMANMFRTYADTYESMGDRETDAGVPVVLGFSAERSSGHVTFYAGELHRMSAMLLADANTPQQSAVAAALGEAAIIFQGLLRDRRSERAEEAVYRRTALLRGGEASYTKEEFHASRLRLYRMYNRFMENTLVSLLANTKLFEKYGPDILANQRKKDTLGHDDDEALMKIIEATTRCWNGNLDKDQIVLQSLVSRNEKSCELMRLGDGVAMSTPKRQELAMSDQEVFMDVLAALAAFQILMKSGDSVPSAAATMASSTDGSHARPPRGVDTDVDAVRGRVMDKQRTGTGRTPLQTLRTMRGVPAHVRHILSDEFRHGEFRHGEERSPLNADDDDDDE